ncbi:MAG: hypothetical protein H3C26_07290 [Rhodocyclaceae bacterium]|nr:hypothetical protein [Rhodocyclaceae bacterium]
MALDTRLVALAQAVGADIKALLAGQGNLAALTTEAKGSLVAALNELHAALSAGAGIDDNAGAGDTDSTWSADRIITALAALKGEIVDGAPAAYDTLLEIAEALGDNDAAMGNLLAAVGNRVRYDAEQGLTSGQQAQARDNIGAVSAAAIGDPETDLVALYVAAKA